MVSVHLEYLDSPLIERVELLANSGMDFAELPSADPRLGRADAGTHSARVNEPFDISFFVRSNYLPVRQA